MLVRLASRFYSPRVSCVFFGFILTAFAQEVSADCKVKYPESEVLKFMDKQEYRDCDITTMKGDYAGNLEVQHRLIKVISPVYKRHVEREYLPAEQQARLDDFSERLNTLLLIKSSEKLTDAIPKQLTGVDDNSAAIAERLEQIAEILKDSQENLKTLKHKVNSVQDSLLQGEHADFCKLNYYFRINEKLNKKTDECLLPD